MKTNTIILMWIALLFTFFFISCASKNIVLEEVSTDIKVEEDKIPPLCAMIIEVEEVRGEQKYIYVKLGEKNEGIKKDLKGLIYNDVAKTEQIGKFQFTQLYKNHSKGQIIELSYPIKQNAIVCVEIDPRFYMK